MDSLLFSLFFPQIAGMVQSRKVGFGGQRFAFADLTLTLYLSSKQRQSILTVVFTFLVETTKTRCNRSQIPVVWYNSDVKKGKSMTLRKLLGLGSLTLWLSLSSITACAVTCGESTYVKQFIEKQDYKAALSEIDNCINTSEVPTAEDLQLFNDLLAKILGQHKVTPEEAYQNFKAILSIHDLKKMEFEFLNHFETHPKDQEGLFSDVHDPSDNYYFYYDTGRLFLHSRGVALTAQAIFWKNLTGEQHKVSFDDIKSLSLIHEVGISLSGWKLRINESADNDIRLSGLAKEGVVPFVAALIYFINVHSHKTEKIALKIPSESMNVLTKSFLERNGRTIAAKASCYAVITAINAASKSLSGEAVIDYSPCSEISAEYVGDAMPNAQVLSGQDSGSVNSPTHPEPGTRDSDSKHTPIASTPSVSPRREQEPRKSENPPPSPSKEESGVVATQSTHLNIRAGAGEQYQVIDKAQKGQTLKILGKVDNWYKVQNGNNSVGYAREDFIELSPASVHANKFPKQTCGDSNPGGTNKWYPVWVDNSEDNLKKIRSHYCRDAFRKTTAEGEIYIQVGSFLKEEDAEEFAMFLQERMGSGQVGKMSER